MIRIPQSYGNALGQGVGIAASNKIDAAQQKELGWGCQSFSTGFTTYGKSMKEQPSAFFVSESSLFIISIVSGDDALGAMLRRHKQEERFEVPLSKVIDIQIRKSGLDENIVGATGDYAMAVQAVVRIKGKRDVLYVTTTDSAVFSRQLMATWHLHIVSKAAGLGGKVRANANKELAYEYYKEILRGYADPRADWRVKEEGLCELGDEVRCDLALKSVVFRHRDLLVHVLNDINEALTKPSGLEKELKSQVKYSTSLGSDVMSGGLAMLQQKLSKVVQRRLAFIRSCLAFFCDLFFCSDSVGNRYQAISTSAPLDPGSWLGVLAPDLFVVLSKQLGVEVDLSEHQADETDLSSRERAKAASRRASSYGQRDDISKMLNDVSKADLTVSAGDDSGKAYDMRASSYNNNKNLDPLLLQTRRSVRDLQHVVTMELYKAMSEGIPGQKSGFGRHYNRITEARSHTPLGDCWIRLEDFDVNLEHLLVRVSSLLDDILTTERARGSVGRRATPKPKEGQSRRPSVEELLVSTANKQPSVPPSPGKGVPASPVRAGTGDGGRWGSNRQKGAGGSPARSVSPLKERGQAPHGPHELGNVTLETQEVLLYYTTSLLLALIRDSGKIREVLGREVSSLWPPIIVTFDVICPRGDIPADEESTLRSEEEEAKAAAAKNSGVLSYFQRCASAGVGAGSRGYDDLGGGESHVAHLMDEMHDEVSKEQKKRLVLEALPLNRYNPMISLTGRTWELLVLSRINVEECMNILNLHGERKGASNGGSGKSGKVFSGEGSKKADAVANPITKRSPRTPRSARQASPIAREESGGIAAMANKVPFGPSDASSSDVENQVSRSNNLSGIFQSASAETASGADSSAASETTTLIGRTRARRAGVEGAGKRAGVAREDSSLLSTSFKERYR